jgi:uncharacterized protein (DUF488 family)
MMTTQESRQEARRLRTSIKQQHLNRDAWNLSRPSRDADFYTVGYSGRSIRTLIESLRHYQIQTLVDTRFTPFSMHRQEFNRTSLEVTLPLSDINYVHSPQLGVPKDIRLIASYEENRELIWNWYDEHVCKRYFAKNLDRFFNALFHPVAFMCTELDPVSCHRHRLALHLEGMGLHSHDIE